MKEFYIFYNQFEQNKYCAYIYLVLFTFFIHIPKLQLCFYFFLGWEWGLKLGSYLGFELSDSLNKKFNQYLNHGTERLHSTR